MAIRNFTDLEVWQLAKALIVKVYKLLVTFPKDEKFGIVGQCKDAVCSIAANILISEALGFINASNKTLYEEILADIDRVAIKLNNFINTNKSRST